MSSGCLAPVRQAVDVRTLALFTSSDFDNCTCFDGLLAHPAVVAVWTGRAAGLWVCDRIDAVDFWTDDFLGTGRWPALSGANASLTLRLLDSRPQGVDLSVRMQTSLFQTRSTALVRFLVASEAVRLPEAVLDRAEGPSTVTRTMADGASVRTKFLARLVRRVAVLTHFQFLRHFNDLHRQRRRGHGDDQYYDHIENLSTEHCYVF